MISDKQWILIELCESLIFTSLDKLFDLFQIITFQNIWLW